MPSSERFGHTYRAILKSSRPLDTSFIKAAHGCKKASPCYQFNSLNFDLKKISVRSPWDHLNVTLSVLIWFKGSTRKWHFAGGFVGWHKGDQQAQETLVIRGQANKECKAFGEMTKPCGAFDELTKPAFTVCGCARQLHR